MAINRDIDYIECSSHKLAKVVGEHEGRITVEYYVAGANNTLITTGARTITAAHFVDDFRPYQEG